MDHQIPALQQNPVLSQSQEFSKFFSLTDLLLYSKNDFQALQLVQKDISHRDCRFFKLTGISYDKEYPHREALENILSALDDPGFNFVYILDGEKSSVSLYVGVVKNGVPTRLQGADYGNHLETLFHGNFSGAEIEKLDRSFTDDVIFLKNENPFRKIGSLVGIPSFNENEGSQDLGFQGVDRLINSMSQARWRVVVVCEPLTESQIASLKEYVYQLYNKMTPIAKNNMQFGENSSKGISVTETDSTNRSKTEGAHDDHSQGSSSGSSDSSKNSNHTWGTNDSKTEGSSHSRADGETNTSGNSITLSVDVANKKAQEAMKYIDEELLKRLKLGQAKGMFKTSVFFATEFGKDLTRLRSNLLSLFQGEQSSYSPLKYLTWNSDDKDYARKLLTNFESVSYPLTLPTGVPLLHSRPFEKNQIALSTYLTVKETCLLAGIPLKEVAGIKVKQGVDFGVNVNPNKDVSAQLRLGLIMQKGNVCKDRPFYLDSRTLTKHVFIGGVTGCGKTTTCLSLLLQSRLPFLVIEPAKTEYRGLVAKKDVIDNVLVFTVGNENMIPFRFNPFELDPGENISSHVDMMKATFTAAYPMEASMPQILEKALYKCYEDKGWDIYSSKLKNGEDPFDGLGIYFPRLSELRNCMDQIVDDMHFAPELQQNYKGSLISRLLNLTVGAKGAMFNCQTSVNFEKLLDRKVILELEELRSPEDKALFMGFVLSHLMTVIRHKFKKNRNFRHVTLVEEAHRLLSRVEYGDSGSKKASVEMFADMLAEVRKYGEGLVIVDQIPEKMAPEVLKNSNTKIIHRIFSKDDKETVGNTMMMDEKQKNFLSNLGVGEAIVFSENTDLPVQVKIDHIVDTSDNEVDEELLLRSWKANKDDFEASYQDTFVQESSDVCVRVFKKICKIALTRDDVDWVDLVERLKKHSATTGMELKVEWQELAMVVWKMTPAYISYKDHSKDLMECLPKFFEAIQNGEEWLTKYRIVPQILHIRRS